jgi:hypothetical protein
MMADVPSKVSAYLERHPDQDLVKLVRASYVNAETAPLDGEV